MLSTFRETIKSLQDVSYGRTIETYSLLRCLWYWSKYLLLIASIPAVTLVLAVTYYTPQLPSLIQSRLPDFELEFSNRRLTYFSPQPLTAGGKGMVFKVDLSGVQSDIDNYESGVLVLEDKFIIKDPDGGLNIKPYPDLGKFRFSRSQIAGLVADRQLAVWGILTGISLFFVVTTTVGYWMSNLLIMILGSVVLWGAFRIFRRPLPFTVFLKLSLYASVLPLLVAAVNALSPNVILHFLGPILFLYYTFTWSKNLVTPK